MKMDESQLVAAIEQHESDSASHGQLQSDREEAQDRYMGRPYGNEIEGRSQVVARDSFETVEWLKPQLADIFTSGEEIVSFSPRGAEDVKGAEQETDAVNHVITQKNDWFLVFINWVHDALVEKNGYVKAYWDDEEDRTREKYQGLDSLQYQRLLQDDDIEVIEASSEMVLGPDGAPISDEQGMPMQMWTCEVERVRPRDIARFENIEPNSVRVSAKARSLSLQDRRLPFVEHSEKKTLSELRNEGFDVPDDISDSGGTIDEWQEEARNEYTPMRDTEDSPSDPSMRMVTVREVWIRVDYDGDGRAELRHVVVVGTTVLLNEDCDVVPIVALSPIPLPHRHDGMSIVEAVLDLEKIHTALFRGALDNQYLANNGRYAIDEDKVNLDDMLDSRAGGVVRTKGGPGEAIFPLTHPTNGTQVVPMMEYVNKLKERRTGVSEQSQGLDPNALNNQAGAAANSAMLSAAQMRIKFIARVFAETGVKSLFQIVHQLMLQNSTRQQVFELRGEWVPVDPRQWVKRNDMVISVALGAGDRVQQLAYLGVQRQMQLEMMPLGITKAEKVYNTVTRMTKAAGYKDPDEFWTDPTKEPPPPPPPPLEIQLEQMKQQGKQAEIQATQQSDVHKFQAEQQLTRESEQLQAAAKLQETQAQLELQAANDERDRQREAESDKRAYQLKIEEIASRERIAVAQIESAERIAAEDRQAQLVQADMQRKTALDTANLTAEASLTQAKMGADTTKETAKLSADTSLKAAAESKAPAAPDKSLSDAVKKLADRFDGIEKHMTSPRKKVRDESGKLVGVEINGVVVPIND